MNQSDERYDVIYAEHRCYLEPHFCREWEIDGSTGEEHGCYGTNPNHGLPFEEAREIVAQWYESKAQEVRLSEPSNW